MDHQFFWISRNWLIISTPQNHYFILLLPFFLLVIWIPVKSTNVSFLSPPPPPYSNTLYQIKNTMKTVAFRLDVLLSHSISLWFLYTPSSPDDLAAHLSLLLWVHKHIQRHIREARVLWLSGWGFYEAGLQTSSTPMFTKPQTDHHITETLLWCVVVTSFMASQTSSISVSQPLNAALDNMTLWLFWSLHTVYFHFLMLLMRCSAGMGGVVLMVVISSGLKTSEWRGSLDEPHQQFLPN